MAELVASMLVGPLVSMVKEKASNYLLDKYNVMEGMEEQHKILKRKLPAILDVIADAEKQSSHREGAKTWLEELKMVAYDANDVFDEFNYEALRRQAKKNGHISKLGMDAMKLLPTHNRVAFRCKMSDKLRRIVEAIEVLVAEMNAFGFQYQKQAPESKLWRQTDSIIVDPDNIISRSRDKERGEIVRILTDKTNTAALTVLPIFGMGGLGKTTLAQLVYNDPQVEKHFDLRRWVCVSEEFDVCDLVNKICENLNEKNLDKALQKLQKMLQKPEQEHSRNRYLLVLDDVWNKDANRWEKLKAYLQQGGMGSFVLTTTRDKGIAELMQTTEARNIASLDDKFLKEIIEKRAFGSLERPTMLVKLVDNIVKRCVGSPLAAKALGSILRYKNTEKEWETILQGSPICTDETGILPILKLSYDDLPSGMKQCFAFCAVFPKDYEIDMDMVIKLWMANGFIPEKKGAYAETTGKRIFNEMVSRSFFQDVKVNTISEEERMKGYYPRTTFKIHDLMHDVALSVMEREVVAITQESSSNIEFLPNTTRHLHFSCYGLETLPILNRSMKKMCLPIQTLMADRYKVDDLQHLSQYSSLRALQLCYLSSGILMRPKHLPHLRYLDLSESFIEALPEDISLLYNLQTLNLSGCIYLDRLPKQMKYMAALRHLYTQGCDNLKHMPPELGLLTSLQTLTYFVVGSGSDCSNLGELQHMNIGGSLLLSQLENVKEQDVKAANLVNKKELRELSLSWSKRGQDDHKVMEGLKSPDGLQALRIYSYQGTTFPMWIGMLQNIHELYLYSCNESRMLPPLCHLTGLEVLCLYELKRLQCLCSGGTSFTFPKLKMLKLKDLEQFTTWCERNWGQEIIIFPRLEKLTISRCGMLIAVPEAPLPQESNGGGNDMAHSTFPALKVLKLERLGSFCDWGASVEAQERPIIFPQLEELSVYDCQKLIALPVAPFLGGSCGQDISVLQSAFPALKVLKLERLGSFCDWGASVEAQERPIIFPQLEELSLCDCQELITLPVAPFLGGSCGQDISVLQSAFPALKVLKLKGLRSFCDWGTSVEAQERPIVFPQLEELSVFDCQELITLPVAPFLGGSCGQDISVLQSAFPALKVLKLERLGSFCDWGVSVEVQERPIIFPQLEELSVCDCQELTALPVAPFLRVSYGQDISVAESAFPALKVLRLKSLESFCEWEPVSIAQGRKIIFPHLEELTIERCAKLRSLPDDISAQSAFSELKELKLHDLKRFNSWGGAERVYDEQQTFPKLERVGIDTCPELTTLPKTPKLLRLDIAQCNPQIYSEIHLCINSLSILNMQCESETMLPAEGNTFELVDGNHECPTMKKMYVSGCNFLFCSPALEQWTSSFIHLQELAISKCDVLVNWPEKEFQSLVSLRKLWISYCNRLIGYAQAGEHPQIESLSIEDCASLVRVEVPASLKTLDFDRCCKLEHIAFGNQQDQAALNQPAVHELSSSTSCLENLVIWDCGNLHLLSGQLDALKNLTIGLCHKLRSVESCSGELPSLERFWLWICERLVSLPNGPQSYSSLRELKITDCPGIKSLPSSLQRRLPSIEETCLDPRYEGTNQT